MHMVYQNIQLLIFGQCAPVGGFKKHKVNDLKEKVDKNISKPVKTDDLIEERKERLKKLDDVQQYELSRDILKQFSLVKKILGNFTFIEKGKQILHTEIISAVLDEIRRERKVKMVLSDDNVEEYVTLDMTEIDIRKNEIDSNLDPNIQIAV